MRTQTLYINLYHRIPQVYQELTLHQELEHSKLNIKKLESRYLQNDNQV